MTITPDSPVHEPTTGFSRTGGAVRLVALDLYRDIHKGIRAELFAVTEEAGRLDPSVADDRAAVAAHVRSVVAMLDTHAGHEDVSIQPVVDEHLPDLAARVRSEHEVLDARVREVAALAEAAVDAAPGARRGDLHRVYIELAAFTAAYLQHQDLEERVLMPALEDAIGVDAVVAIHQSIIGSIPPDELARSLAVMLPAMNVEDRTELLSGLRANAPAEVFDGVWRVAGSVLAPPDHEAVAGRLGLS